MSAYRELRKRIKDADAIIVSASNGFSISEGLNIFADDEAFREIFGDFREKYGIRNILQGALGRWPVEEEKWAFLGRLIRHYSLEYSGSPVMDALKQILGDTPYFVVTSNAESHFELAGLDPERIFEVEGSWKYMSCIHGCGQDLCISWDAVRNMEGAEKNTEIPSDKVPRCPSCGGPMQIHMQPKPKQVKAFRDFVKSYHGKKLLVLEMGIGASNRLIKAPLMELVDREPNAFYITCNKGDLYIPDRIKAKSAGLDGDLCAILPELV